MNDSTTTLLHELGDDHGRELPATPEQILRLGKRKQRRQRGTVAIAGTAALTALGFGLVSSGVLDTGTASTQVAGRPTAGAPSPAGVDITWTRLATGAHLPTSASAGPRILSGGRATGFAPSDLGAVFAAIHIAFRADAFSGPSVFEPTIRDQVTGFDTDELLRLDRDGYRLASPRRDGGPLTGDASSVVLGYRVLRSSADDVTVRILLSAHTSPVALETSVRWVDDDWKLVAPRNGIWNIGRATDIDQFIRFPAPPSGATSSTRPSASPSGPAPSS